VQYNPVYRQLNKPVEKKSKKIFGENQSRTNARRFLFHVSARRFESAGVAARIIQKKK
jgi:hypothetical protein